MFEWLEEEIKAVKTPRFHIVESGRPRLQDAVLGSALPVPHSYKQFVLKFGNAKLYRNSRNNIYRIGVFASPRAARLCDGTPIFILGWYDEGSAFVKHGHTLADPPIFELEMGSAKRVADGFDQWLAEAAANVRNAYGKRRWAAIVHGPLPFSREEQEVLVARRHFQWKVLGINSEGDHVFEVKNNANRVLPALTIGVRSKDRRLNGAIRLNTAHIKPGQSDLLHADCYKELVQPQEIEIFELPDPNPEDREYYWEFRK